MKICIANITDDILWGEINGKEANPKRKSIDTSFTFDIIEEAEEEGYQMIALFEPYYFDHEGSIKSLKSLIKTTTYLKEKFKIKEKIGIILLQDLGECREVYVDNTIIKDGPSERKKILWELIYDSGFHIYDFSYIAKNFSNKEKYSYTNWITRRSPYKINYIKEMAKFVVPELKKRYDIKAIIVDLDNTLWKGTIADNGIDGIEMKPPTYEGQIFQDIQIFIKQRISEGIIACISSKNEEEDAKKAIEKSSVLKWSDFTIKKVNWNKKSKAIEEIKEELNISEQNICYIDDSVFEREEVRINMQELVIPELPNKAEKWIDFLLERRYFVKQSKMTDEDGRKKQLYKAKYEFEKDRKLNVGHDEFLESCKINVRIEKIKEGDEIRHKQLIKKTNQFRLKLDEGRDWKNENVQKYSINVKDIYADHGLCGLIYLDRNNERIIVEEWIMSCRIFTRRIEHKILELLMNKANNSMKLEINYNETGRNKYVNRFLTKEFNYIDYENKLKELRLKSKHIRMYSEIDF